MDIVNVRVQNKLVKPYTFSKSRLRKKWPTVVASLILMLFACSVVNADFYKVIDTSMSRNAMHKSKVMPRLDDIA